MPILTGVSIPRPTPVSAADAASYIEECIAALTPLSMGPAVEGTLRTWFWNEDPGASSGLDDGATQPARMAVLAGFKAMYARASNALLLAGGAADKVGGQLPSSPRTRQEALPAVRVVGGGLRVNPVWQLRARMAELAGLAGLVSIVPDLPPGRMPARTLAKQSQWSTMKCISNYQGFLKDLCGFPHDY